MTLFKLQHVGKKFQVRKKNLFSPKEWIDALQDINLEIREGETLGIVGESGCGKSTLGKVITGIHPVDEGEVWFKGKNISTFTPEEKKEYHRSIQAVFQDPYSSLNPKLTIERILEEPLDVGFSLSDAEKNEKIKAVLQRVGIDQSLAGRYPRAFSGGQRQRISIARALLGEPRFLLCDEPISALDVSIQAQIMNLLSELKEEYHLTMLFISHNIAMVRHISDRIAVMYLGHVVELGDADEVADHPKHPYTQQLLSAVLPPELPKRQEAVLGDLEVDVPVLTEVPKGCPYHPRCPKAMPICRENKPPSYKVDGVEVACFLYKEDA